MARRSGGQCKKIKLTDDEIMAIAAKKDKFLRNGVRKCHDCGTLTYNYRCGRCREAWQRKHKVPVGYQYVADSDFDI